MNYRTRTAHVSLRRTIIQPLLLVSLLLACTASSAQSLDIPCRHWGISIGNSRSFTGLRINFRDRDLERINGLNITLWSPHKNAISGTVNGISLGIMPQADKLRGLQIGFGVGAGTEVKGITIGILGAGSGGSIEGINIGGLGIGAGGDMRGFSIGLLGAGAGGNMSGINIGGLGLGAGGSMTGINIGGLGLGAGGNMSGINIGGLGLGAGESLSGINIALFGAGAGKQLRGLTIAGLGAGAGEEMRGITICGLGAGSVKVRGITAAGFAVGGVSVRGIALSLGTIKVKKDGDMTGLAVSSFNHIQGTMKGVSIGLVNYAHTLKGIQIGLVNIVRDNPGLSRVLPVINARF